MTDSPSAASITSMREFTAADRLYLLSTYRLTLLHNRFTTPEAVLQAGGACLAELHIHRAAIVKLVRQADLTFELQVATYAQRVWADLAHPLTYKPDQDPPEQIRRSLHRLAAVLEIVDDEFARAKAVISDLEGFEEFQLLGELERHFYRFAARPYNRELSLEILGALKAIPGASNVAEIASPISSFLDKNETKIEELFADYREDDRYPLLFQPEILLVFWRLECDSYTLKEAWQKALPEEYLTDLETIWGKSL